MTKRTPLQIAKDKAWDTFSLWIRTRDNFTCVSCGTTTGIMQGGHFFHGVLDFDEENINCQCARCNHFLSGNLAPYSVYLLAKIGKKGFEALNKRHYMAMKGEKHELQYYLDIIAKYSILPLSSVRNNP